MKKFLFLLSLTFLVISCASAKSISVSDLIPDDCTNAVIVLQDRRSGNYNKHEHYYLDDATEIKAVFSEWKELKKIPAFPRYIDSGFSCDFNFYLIIDGQKQACPIDGISPDGAMIKINNQGYKYNREYWKELRQKLKAAKIEEIICADAHEYRSVLAEIKKDSRYIFSKNNFTKAKQSIPEKYDGYFYITTNNSSSSSIENKISKAYPDADFRIGEQLGGGLFRSCDYQIYASREFYEEFNLYPKNDYKGFKDIKLTVYLKE